MGDNIRGAGGYGDFVRRRTHPDLPQHRLYLEPQGGERVRSILVSINFPDHGAVQDEFFSSLLLDEHRGGQPLEFSHHDDLR